MWLFVFGGRTWCSMVASEVQWRGIHENPIVIAVFAFVGRVPV